MSSDQQLLRLRKTLTALGWAFAFAVICGCEEPTSGLVTGRVTVDGVEAKSGSIAFIPVDGKGSTAGAVIADGRYETTASFGAMKVEIRVPKVIGQKKLYDTPDSRVRQMMAETLPARYNDKTELQVEIKPDQLEHNFELTTK